MRVLCSKSLPILRGSAFRMTGILSVDWDSAFFFMIHIGLIIIKRLGRTIDAVDFDAMGRGTKTAPKLLKKTKFWTYSQNYHKSIFLPQTWPSWPTFPNFGDLGIPGPNPLNRNNKKKFFSASLPWTEFSVENMIWRDQYIKYCLYLP